MPKLKPVLFLGIAGGVVAAIRKRASKEQLQEAAGKASDLADRAKQAAPEPVKQAVETAVQTVTDTVSKVQGGDDEPQTTRVHSVATDEEPSLDATRAHDLPKDVKMPDVSDDDPAVQEAEAAAAADASAIGGNKDENQP